MTKSVTFVTFLSFEFASVQEMKKEEELREAVMIKKCYFCHFLSFEFKVLITHYSLLITDNLIVCFDPTGRMFIANIKISSIRPLWGRMQMVCVIAINIRPLRGRFIADNPSYHPF
jgi:hypothetical protein